MLKKIWQSFVRWFRKLFGRGAASRDRLVSTAELPPLDDTDREYLFMQLLEGVAHGWQQPRAIGFFNKIRQRVRKSEWLEWLDRFGNNLLKAPVPNYELAGRMVQLGELDCGEICDLAGEYGVRLLNRQAEEFPGDLLPIMEFSSLASADMDIDGENISYGRSGGDNRHFSEVPMELLIDNDPLPSPPPRSIAPQSETDSSASETREITLEEFSAMLYTDPDLVAELAEQFGVETTDPQVIVNAVVAQMQQQVQQISGDLTPVDRAETPEPPPVPAPPETPPATPPEIPTPRTTPPATPPEVPPVMPPDMPPVAPPAPEVPPAMPPTTPPLTPEATISTPTSISPAKQAPPPPPSPKLEYKSDDPWNSSNLLGNPEQIVPETAKMPDRGV
jgi:hypothetical protein